jgi:hypothetical protein
MKKCCLLLFLFSCSVSFAQVKTLNKRKLSSVKPNNSASGPVQSANGTSNVSTVINNTTAITSPTSTRE